MAILVNDSSTVVTLYGQSLLYNLNLERNLEKPLGLRYGRICVDRKMLKE